MGCRFWGRAALRRRCGGRARRGRWAALSVALAFSAGLTVTAGAADQPKPFQNTPEAQEADQLFQQLLKDPKNVDLTFRYAQAAIKSGNIEGAISSLERLLLLDRNFPGVKIQLAELYADLKSYNMAKTYLTQARAEPGVNAESLSRIDKVQSEIDRAESKTNYSVNLLVGLRYQTDASAEPAGSDIIAGGVPQTLSSIYLHQPAWDSFVTGNVQYIAEFGDVKLESNAIAYYSKAIGHSFLDLAAVEVNSGPRFDVDFNGIHFVSARAYAVANEVTLGESQFLHSAGGGLTFDRSLTDKLAASGFYEFRREWFDNVTLSPAAVLMNADVHSFGSALTYHVIETGDLNFQVSYALTDDVAPGSNRGLVFHLSYSQLFQLPSEYGVGPLNLSPMLYRIYSHDHAPDAAVNPNIIPATNEWRYGVSAKLGLTDNIATNLNVIHQVLTSNVQANRAHDTQVILGLVFSY
jgi:tetratricopeptide (TPR) repeat protein